MPDDGNAIGRDSLAFIQLAKQNDRLKEALMRCGIRAVERAEDDTIST